MTNKKSKLEEARDIFFHAVGIESPISNINHLRDIIKDQSNYTEKWKNSIDSILSNVQDLIAGMAEDYVMDGAFNEKKDS